MSVVPPAESCTALGRFGPELTGRTPTTVLVITTGATDLVAALTAAFPAAEQHMCSTMAEVGERLLTIRPPDVIIDDGTVAPDRRAKVFRAAFLHLRRGGLYLADRVQDTDLIAYLDLLKAIAGHPRPKEFPGAHRDDVERARTVARLTRHDTVAAVERSGSHYVKLRDHQTVAALAGRRGDRWGAELFALGPRVFRPATAPQVAEPSRPVRARFERSMAVPALFARVYHDVVCAPRQLVLSGDALPSISFHHPLANRLTQRATHDIGSDVTRLRAKVTDAESLAGDFYHLDSEWPGHFGHFMTEDLARLWGWPEAKQRYPDLRLLLSVDEPGQPLEPFRRTLLNAYGIGDDDIVCIDRPVRLQNLVGVSPMLHNSRYVHPELPRTWDVIRDELAPVSVGPRRRLFVVRPAGASRTCRNASEVEAVFRRSGFEIVAPETRPMAEQVALFADASVVAGYGGSGMFGALFSRGPLTQIVFASETYNSSNEWLITAARGGSYHHFWGTPDLVQSAESWSAAAFHSNFTVDLSRLRRTLRRLLRRI